MQKRESKRWLYLIVISLIWFAIGWTAHAKFGPSLSEDANLVASVRRRLAAEYPGELPSDRELTYGAIRGMLQRSGDDYASLIEPPISYRFQDDFAGRSGVVGLVPKRRDGQMVVGVVFPGDPAYETGLRSGDVILAVDGVPISDETDTTEISLLIRGPVGEPVRFLVRRGEEELRFAPVRRVRTVAEVEMLEGDVGYLQQHTFTANAPEEVRVALEELLAHDPRALIWDLRSNGGGSMEATQRVLSYFIDEGLLFTVALGTGEEVAFDVVPGDFHVDLPLVVLTGEHTYSSAETAAVAIAERGRGTVIGETTYGKGTIYATYPLDNEALIQLTIGKWLSPQGNWYDNRGFEPQITVVEDDATEEDEVLDVALDYLKKKGLP